MSRRAWLPLDLVVVGVFAVLGRLNHYDSLTLGGWWRTAWPFLVGAALGWAVVLVLRRPGGAIGAGVMIWLVTLGAGMLLRQFSGQGTATPFVIVATLVLGGLLVLPRVGWRMGRALVFGESATHQAR